MKDICFGMNCELVKLTKMEKKYIGLIWLFYSKHNRLPTASQVGAFRKKTKQYGYKMLQILIDKYWIYRNNGELEYRITDLAKDKIERALSK